MKPFSPHKKRKSLPYLEVPHDIIEDRDQLQTWAREAIAAAKRAKQRPT